MAATLRRTASSAVRLRRSFSCSATRTSKGLTALDHNYADAAMQDARFAETRTLALAEPISRQWDTNRAVLGGPTGYSKHFVYRQVITDPAKAREIIRAWGLYDRTEPFTVMDMFAGKLYPA